jgi:hypothetical protein
MTIVTFRYPVLTALLFILASAGPAPLVSVFAQVPEAMIEKKQTLTARLDSIELEMQMRKRQGEDLEKLETLSQQLRDSVALLREQIDARVDAVGGITTVAPPGISIPGLEWFEPEGTFDWVVLGVVAVALLAGLVLVLSLIRAAATRKRRRPVRSRQAADAPSRPPVPPPARPDPPSAASASPANADRSNEELESLLQRIQQDGERRQQQKSSARIEPPQQQQTTRVGNLREQILAAAGQGLSAQEISRRLHASVDQVNLILRLADRDRSS